MAIRINLLDWRAERRDHRRKEFLAMLGSAVGAALAAAVIGTLFVDHAIDNQNARNRYLQEQISRIDHQIARIKELDKVRNDLLARMHVIESLQQTRSAAVHFFDEIVNTLPDGVYLTSLKQEGQNVTLQGVAQSNARVSAYMMNLDASPWFSDPRLVIIKTSEHNHLHRSDFTLTVKNLTTASAKSGADDHGEVR